MHFQSAHYPINIIKRHLMLRLTSPLQKLEYETKSVQISEECEAKTPQETRSVTSSSSRHLSRGGDWRKVMQTLSNTWKKDHHQACANICASCNYCCLWLKAAAVQPHANVHQPALAPNSLTRKDHSLIFISACMKSD